jgi:predicted PurR-regulated permease PerM
MISWLGLAALGVPGALYLGIIAGLLEIIPNIGPVISAIPAVIVAVLMGSNYLPVNSLIVALLVILLYTAVQQLENNLIVPRVLGGAVELPSLIVMLGVIVGTSIGGILGALLATPVIASGREIVRYLYRKTLGEEPFPIGEASLKPEKKTFSNLLQPLRGWLQRLVGSRSLASRQRVPDTSPTPDSVSEAEDDPQNNQ